MARFDVYANPGSHSATTPYLLDVQSDLLDGLDSRMVCVFHGNWPPIPSQTGRAFHGKPATRSGATHGV
jgi:hypothetical protein